MFHCLSGAAVEPRHIAVAVPQVFLPVGTCRPGVALLAERSLSRLLRHVGCSVLWSIFVCVCGLDLPCLGACRVSG